MSEWIYTKDRLPESDFKVLACFEDGFQMLGFYDEDSKKWSFVGDTEYDCKGEVIAWMHLPVSCEPKKEISVDEAICKSK